MVAIPGRAEGDEGGRVALEAWAKRGDEQAVNAIIGAAETNSAIREHAIILLGGMKSDLAAAYLATQVTNEDERIACRAVTELARSKGVDSIPHISAALLRNRTLEGGPSGEIWDSCAKALGETRCSEAMPVIERELKWVAEGGVHLEYGSQLVDALERIGDSRAAAMLQSYADLLQASLSGMPKVRQVQMVKIMEARKAAETLK